MVKDVAISPCGFDHIEEMHLAVNGKPRKLEWRRMSMAEVPQIRKRAYAMKYLECLLTGQLLNAVTDENVKFFREKLSVNVFTII
ncbi:hypothetical protein PanWU01x14_248800 [Parasponia andersonii]|uniref:Uncharacterized protein n=1 Tax=Parasponia andersonii TaxID=3476 RepID=A0A2P5BDB7_PARAD|nr:hypothetical protein PanWU01x14_248800 [Parasponia andersonii]